MGVTLPRDAYLDNCKFALMILIGIGHALQWLLAVEDARVSRGWCSTDGADAGGGGAEGGDGDGNGSSVTNASSIAGFSPSSTSSSWAVIPLRALYTWSNAIAIPMFCVISGHLSRSLAGSSSQGDGKLLSRMRRNAESLLAPFLLFQALACAVEAASPALRGALAPSGVSGSFRDRTRSEMEAEASLDLWAPHISWYLLALALWRGLLPVFAQMRPTAATALAAIVGVGVGFTNTGAATGYFLKWGTVWGNFPYFALGTALTEDHYRAVRNGGGGGQFRAAAAGITLAALAGVLWGLSAGSMCFDAWQWEAWKSAPYVHYSHGREKGSGVGVGGGRSGNAAAAGAVDAEPRSLATAALFRTATYVGATAVGFAFLAALPRGHLPWVSPLGGRTVYGYLLHAPALLGVMAASGVFERAGRGGGLGGWEAVCVGVALPVVVTAACMSRLAQVCFWWLCEPRFGGLLWRPKEEERRVSW